MLLTLWNATIKWSNKVVSTFREMSNTLVVATLSDGFYLSTSVFFLYVMAGLLFSLHRKYRDHFIPYIIGGNFAVLGQVEQTLSWETFFNVTLKQVGGHRRLPASGDTQPLLPDISFLRRVDLYPDLLVLKLNGRWRSVIDQNYTGLSSPGEEGGEGVERSLPISSGGGSEVDFFRLFARKGVHFPPHTGGRPMASSSRRKGRPRSPSKSYPLLELGRRGAYNTTGWFYTLSMPWDELPFRLESDNIVYDGLQWGEKQGGPFLALDAFPVDERGEIEWETMLKRLAGRYGDDAVKEMVDEVVDVDSDETPWEDILPDDAVDGRAMSGHRCPDTDRRGLKALLLHQRSQRLVSLRPFHRPRSLEAGDTTESNASREAGWQDCMQTVQIPLPSTVSLPHAVSPFDRSPPPVDIKYHSLQLVGLKRFEAKFRESVQDLITSEEMELIPMESMFYRGLSVDQGDTGVEKDVVNLNEERSDDIHEWGIDAMGVANPAATQQQNFFGRKSVLRDDPATPRVVALANRHRERMLRRRHDKSDPLAPTKNDQTSSRRFFEAGSEKAPSTGALPSFAERMGLKQAVDPTSGEERVYALAYEEPEEAFLSAAPVEERPMITIIRPDDWNRMVEAQIEGAVDVRTHLAKFALEFPTIPVAERTGRPFLWPLTQLDYRNLPGLLLEHESISEKVAVPGQEKPLIVCHYAPQSHRPINEPSVYASLIDPAYQRSRSRFGRKRWRGWLEVGVSRMEGWLNPSSRLRSLGSERVRSRRQLWEPITLLSWLMAYKFLFVMWVERLVKDFYQSYGKEILLYFVQLLAALGFDGEALIEDLGLGEDPDYLRIIPKTEKRFQDLAGIDATLPTLGEMVWFLRSSGRGRKIPKGILLVGPPGTGKTFLVQAVAGEAEVPVVIQLATLLIDPEQKESPLERLKHVFDQARRSAPCILFIDEIDTLGACRQGVMRNTMGGDRVIESIVTSSNGDGKAEEEGDGQWFEVDRAAHLDRERVVQSKVDHSHETISLMEKQRLSLLMQLLVEMDGLQTFDGLIVVGATNRPGVLDPALLRPGRFEKVVHLELPVEGKRIEILQLYSRNIGISQDVSWRYLACRTVGFSTADLSAVMNQSSIQAILHSTTHTIETIEAGIEIIGRQTIQKGLPTGRGFLDPFLPARLAYYQAGKAVVRTTLPPHPAVSYLTLWPQSGVQPCHLEKGVADDPFRQTADRLGLEARVIGLYGGKAGELFALSNDARLPPRKRQIADRGVWDSDLGAEEIQLATKVANSMVNGWSLHSNEISLKERNRLLATQNGEEIEDPLERKFYTKLSDEKRLEGERGEEGQPGSQGHSFSAWWQTQVTKELESVQTASSQWYRFYLPHPAESGRNDEWLVPDEYYHAPPAARHVGTKERGASVSWNDVSLLDRDFLLHALLTTCFNEALLILEGRRELLDYFADHLIRFHVLRRHTIQLIALQFTM